MDADVIELTRALCAVPSPTGAEGAVVARAEELLTGLGWAVRRQEVTTGRDNLLALRGTPEVILSTHLDTVPPHVPLTEDGDWLRGRGTVDAKGIAAAMITAADRLAREGEARVGLLFLVGEEDGSDGALAARSFGPRGRFLVNGEPTENRLVVGQKGALRILLEAEGRAAHSGYPDEGVSAVEPLLDTLEAIRAIPLPADPVLGPSTLNIGRMNAGVAPNVIPPHGRAELLVRTIGDTSAYRAAVTEAASPGVRVTFPLDIPAVRSTPLDGWEATVVAYTSDWPLLESWGEGYQLGPGSIRVAHTDDEAIRTSELVAGVDAYVRLVRHLLARCPA